ncbi:MarR family winged helix-turn-helix transcriptional regulator [Lachnospira sp.]|jgi:DNA-binding MarR family transcriptional regulator|uniref:MarR family winged helix-turn-helix transcriptional regulator n=1 Tax=Lachnospira sp. TaxID=2049031 RepID=UPI00257C02DD|nr:MarR family winged helix-turn-helix transcriptional regulator [Lachnospira sp.]
MDIYESLNKILVDLFNDILDIEEKALITEEFKDISVNDMHIIDAVGIKDPQTMGEISKTLGVTMGTLTIGLNRLVKKGYAVRYRSDKDRRVVYATLTEKGIAAYFHHQKFHKKMIEKVTEDLSPSEAETLVKTFDRLEAFFKSYDN